MPKKVLKKKSRTAPRRIVKNYGVGDDQHTFLIIVGASCAVILMVFMMMNNMY